MYHYLGLPILTNCVDNHLCIENVCFIPIKCNDINPLGILNVTRFFEPPAIDISVFSAEYWAYQTVDRLWHLVYQPSPIKDSIELTAGLKVLYVEVPKYKNDHKDEFMISLKMPDGKWFWIAHFKDKVVLQSVNMGLIKREFTKLEEAFDFLRSIYGEKHDAK
jgi:hypothetical protein